MADAPDPQFIDARTTQFQELRRLLVDRGGAVVNLHGAPGSGKTTLARYFADQHGAAFPGGTLLLSANGDLTRHRPLLKAVSSDQPLLLILDDFQFAAVNSVSPMMRELDETRPLVGVLVISDIPISPTAATERVEMPPLPGRRVLAMLSERGGFARAELQGLQVALEGNTAAVTEVSRRLAAGVPPDRILAWFEAGRLPVAWDARGDVLRADAQPREALELAVSEISEELIAELVARPELLYRLDPRKFERLIAELYRRRGFEVQLTPASGDEGVDVYVVRHDELGSSLSVVQAKRYAANRKIGAGVVRELYGTVMAKHASAGILVTTSFFEPGAEKMQRELEYRLNLRNYFALQEMLRWPPR